MMAREVNEHMSKKENSWRKIKEQEGHSGTSLEFLKKVLHNTKRWQIDPCYKD